MTGKVFYKGSDRMSKLVKLMKSASNEDDQDSHFVGSIIIREASIYLDGYDHTNIGYILYSG